MLKAERDRAQRKADEEKKKEEEKAKKEKKDKKKKKKEKDNAESEKEDEAKSETQEEPPGTVEFFLPLRIPVPPYLSCSPSLPPGLHLIASPEF